MLPATDRRTSRQTDAEEHQRRAHEVERRQPLAEQQHPERGRDDGHPAPPALTAPRSPSLATVTYSVQP
jgi:hypothetical protein